MSFARLVAISDFCTHVPPHPVPAESVGDGGPAPRRLPAGMPVRGGYLERLPLALMRAGWVQGAEIWDFAGSDDAPCGIVETRAGLDLRRFRADGNGAPYASRQMAAHIARYGAPEILCVWGLGVTEEILGLCSNSIRIYNSLDVEALRIPPALSRHFDIFLTGSPAQEAAVRARHPDALTAVLPIGPEFASPLTFRPLGLPKTVDLVYVAAAQGYKRHDILFNAMATLPPEVSALCVMGYGEEAERLRQEAAARGLNIRFVGPPGVSHDEVNLLMNSARIGLVCGVEDGAPAILTEYMLAGLPVLANAGLRCGLQYIRPDTGMAVPEGQFGAAIRRMLATHERYAPRDTVLANWAWPHSVQRLGALIEAARARRACGRVA